MMTRIVQTFRCQEMDGRLDVCHRRHCCGAKRSATTKLGNMSRCLGARRAMAAVSPASASQRPTRPTCQRYIRIRAYIYCIVLSLYMMMMMMIIIIIIIIRHRYGYSIKTYESGLTGVLLITRPVAPSQKERKKERKEERNLPHTRKLKLNMLNINYRLLIIESPIRPLRSSFISL